jgi:hypothetical protein
VVNLPEKGPWPIAMVIVIIGLAALVVGGDYVLRLHWSGGGVELAPAQTVTVAPTIMSK